MIGRFRDWSLITRMGATKREVGGGGRAIEVLYLLKVGWSFSHA